MLKLPFITCGVALVACSAVSMAAVHGHVMDLNGAPVTQAMVTLTKSPGVAGATATSVFADASGAFAFAENTPPGKLTVRALNYRQVVSDIRTNGGPLTILMRPAADQSGVAPASAYLMGMTSPAEREDVVMTCVGCHQFPAPEVRDYANLLDDTPETQSPSAKEEAWAAIVTQMNYIGMMEFSRILGPGRISEAVSLAGDPLPKGKLLAHALRGPMREVRGYQYGAPLIVTPRTTIREFEVPLPNAIRDAASFDGTDYVYSADVSTNHLVRVDTHSGAVKIFVIPGKEEWYPHTVVPGAEGLWVAPLNLGGLLRFDPRTEQWKIWHLSKTTSGLPVALHDISFDSNHELETDRHGRIWFSDIQNNGVGWLDPKTGESGDFMIPPVPGRVGGEQVYGLAMSPDRVHVWYCQLGIGSCGSFNTETSKFETHIAFDSPNAGPRRISISDDGMLYIGLYGAGQLAVYDTNALRMVGIFDLPDRASAPYATTWDPVRKVVWISASNSNTIYRFDPRDHSFGVLPLPRERAFLRILHVDRKSGMLVTSYANIIQHVRGPRMVVTIDPGDGAVKAAKVTDHHTAGEVAR